MYFFIILISVKYHYVPRETSLRQISRDIKKAAF